MPVYMLRETIAKELNIVCKNFTIKSSNYILDEKQTIGVYELEKGEILYCEENEQNTNKDDLLTESVSVIITQVNGKRTEISNFPR